MRTAFFTIASWNYVFFARTWAESARATNPGVDIILVLADVERPEFDAGPMFDMVIPFEALGIHNAQHLAFRYDIKEMNTSLKPSGFLKLFELGYDRVLFFDPDTCLFNRVDAVTEAFERGANSVLTPHGTEPNENPEVPNEMMFLVAGIYNLGFMAIAKCDETVRLLEWWARRLEYLSVLNRVQDGIFADQKWMDLWPAYCSGAAILRHPGYNVAFFNLDARPIERTDGGYRAAGLPLVFYHFTGLVPGNRDILSVYQHRIYPNFSDTLSALFNDYQDRIEKNRSDAFAQAPYGFGFFENGAKITVENRWHFRDTLEPFTGNPFSAESYAAWFAPPEPPSSPEPVAAPEPPPAAELEPPTPSAELGQVFALPRFIAYFRPIYRLVPAALRQRLVTRMLRRPS